MEPAEFIIYNEESIVPFETKLLNKNIFQLSIYFLWKIVEPRENELGLPQYEGEQCWNKRIFAKVNTSKESGICKSSNEWVSRVVEKGKSKGFCFRFFGKGLMFWLHDSA